MRNRWIQLSASLLAMIMIANLQYSWTLFVNPLRDATHWRLSEIQWAFTLFVICETWVMPMEGWIIDRMGPQIFTTIAGVLCGIGWGGLAFVHTLNQLYVFYAIAGVGAAFVYAGSIASALKWFPDRRGLASGIIAAGFGGGSGLFIPIIQWLIKTHSYRDAFLYTGVIQGLVIIAVAQVLRHPKPGELTQAVVSRATSPYIRRNAQQFSTPEMLKTPHFYVLYIMMVLMATGGLMVTAEAAPLGKTWGITAGMITVAVSLDRVSNGASRICWGWFSDRIGREYTMAIAFALQAGCLLAFLWLGKSSGMWFTITLIAVFLTYGEIFSLFPSTVGDYFGAKSAASNYSFLYSGKGVASIIGGGIAARLYEQTGSWSGALYGAAAFALLAALMAIGIRMFPLPGKASASAHDLAHPLQTGTGLPPKTA
jgi:OFA family oxalate/formate antiporter-like MFS transporter